MVYLDQGARAAPDGGGGEPRNEARKDPVRGEHKRAEMPIVGAVEPTVQLRDETYSQTPYGKNQQI